jgi:hypothetical protein
LGQLGGGGSNGQLPIEIFVISAMKQNRLNGLAAAYIHKDLDINPDEILKLYTQMNSRHFDFGV